LNWFLIRQILVFVVKQLNMESITIHPENAEQLKTVKSVLKALKVPFEPQSSALPNHVMASIAKGQPRSSPFLGFLYVRPSIGNGYCVFGYFWIYIWIKPSYHIRNTWPGCRDR